MDVDLPNRLRNKRLISGLTVYQLAIRIGVREQTIRRWECGQHNPDVLTAQRLAKILNSSIDEIWPIDKDT